ncbi:MAG: hypothetical protein MJB14_06870 [Spirochaetes bacterium]|nr:hypothetical protein [Spirochaetota bacterium]
MKENIEIKPYPFQDETVFSQPERGQKCLLLTPDQTIIVLGRGSKEEEELFFYPIIKDDIPVTRRKSGGCTVVLTSRMLIIAFIEQKVKLESPLKYFQKYNEIIINGLNKYGITPVEKKGISDLTIGNLKICGSSIYTNLEKIFFHAVLNIAEDPRLFEKYLKHPPREPDYRQQRKHHHFVSSLKKLGYEVDVENLKKALQISWDESQK